MANVLSVPHFPQETDGYCLPACAQMVLKYLGVVRSQAELALQLGTRANIGTPHSHLTRLKSPTIDVLYAAGDWDDLQQHLEQERPVIVFVQAGELPHWRGRKSRHAVVVVGIGLDTASVLDPASSPKPIDVPVGDFMLAWDEFDNTFAVISLRQ